MTIRVNPTIDDTVHVQQTAAAIRYAGGSRGWIVPPGDDPGSTARVEPDIDHTVLEAFKPLWSSDSLDVTFAPGQAYVGGCWLAKDTTTTVTLDANEDNQGIFLAVDLPEGDGSGATGNNIKIGPHAFGWQDQAIPLARFDTDSSGVTDFDDRRNVDDYRIHADDIQGDVQNKRVETWVTGETHSATLAFIPNFDEPPVLSVFAEETDNDEVCVASAGYVGSDQTTVQAFKLDGSPVQTVMHIVARER